MYSVTEAKRRKRFKEIVTTVLNAAEGLRKIRAEKLCVFSVTEAHGDVNGAVWVERWGLARLQGAEWYVGERAERTKLTCVCMYIQTCTYAHI